MINPFEISGDIDHLPNNISAAFEEVGLSSTDTASLLASKSKMFSTLSYSKSGKTDLETFAKQSELRIESGLSLADLKSDTFTISKSTKEDKSFKPSFSINPIEKKAHCETCKCITNNSISNIPMVESTSLQYLSKLESILPSKTALKGKINKPYTSPIYKLPASPSQIFRQRINSHILHSTLPKQRSQGLFYVKKPSNTLLY